MTWKHLPIALALLLAGCLGVGNDAEIDENEGNEALVEDPRTPATWQVMVHGTMFMPADLTIQVNDTVKWMLAEGLNMEEHTVTSNNGTFHSGPCPGPDCFGPAPEPVNRKSFSYLFDEVGKHQYHCHVHPTMTGLITVLERYEKTPEA